MPIEVELKLRITDDLSLQRLMKDGQMLAHSMDEFHTIDMRAVYFDTKDHDLSTRKWALRLRKENGVSVGVFKGNSVQNDDGVFIRDEFSVPADTLDMAIPKLLEVGAPPELATFGPYLERCHIDFIRNACSVSLPNPESPNPTIFEFAVDVGKIVVEQKQELLQELELELLAGEADPMVEFSKSLTQKYNLTKEHYSKYTRALFLLRSR
jgi:inorganic triphosphatase YgiF